MSTSEPPDLPSGLIMRALDGDPAAFRSFYRRYDPTVRWAVGLRIYRWPELVPEFEDVVQEVWLGITKERGKRLRYHDPARGLSFERFLAMISTRLAWRIAMRRRSPTPAELGEMHDDVESFAEHLMNAEVLERLAELVKARLDDKDQGLFEGYYVRGELLKDIGARLGMSESATYKRNERMQKKLRELVHELLDEAPTEMAPGLVAVLVAALAIMDHGMSTTSSLVPGSVRSSHGAVVGARL